MKTILVNPNLLNPLVTKYHIKNKESFLRDMHPSTNVNLLHTLAKNHHKIIPYDHLMAYLRSGFKKELSLEKGLINLIEQEKPEMVGFSGMTHTRKAVFDLARQIKKTNPHIKLVLGGPITTSLPPNILENYRNKLFDFILVGEADTIFLDFLNKPEKYAINDYNKKLDKTKDGLIFAKRFLQDLDSLPNINYDSYMPYVKSLQTIAISTERGCPMVCSFCSNMWGRRRSFKSIERVIEEISYYKNTYDAKNIIFWEDSTTFDQKKAKNIFDGIYKKDFGINISLETRIDKINKELLVKFKKAGGRGLYLGIESGSARLRKKIKKGIDNQIIEKGIKLVKEIGLDFHFYIMLGIPGENISTLRETYEFLKKANPSGINCSVLRVSRGQPLYSHYESQGLVSDEFWKNENNKYFRIPNQDFNFLRQVAGFFLKEFNKQEGFPEFKYIETRSLAKVNQIEKIRKLFKDYD